MSLIAESGLAQYPQQLAHMGQCFTPLTSDGRERRRDRFRRGLFTVCLGFIEHA